MWSRERALAVCAGLSLLTAGCYEHGMEEQAKAKPLSESRFFADGRSARPLVEGTVARGHLKTDSLLYEGKSANREADVFPFPVTRAVLERGRQRYDIYCAACHARTGDGDGMVVRRGFPRPPSYHSARLRAAPAGHFVNVIAHGYGTMFSYEDVVAAEDRWAIAAYIRALQLSQTASLGDVPSGERVRLKESD